MTTVAETTQETKGTANWPVECREQLSRILHSPEFQMPERGRQFLTYVVKETLSGRSERIKAYTIATEVFGRNVSFDPYSDPIVRIEAGHLRRALERYYFTGGKDDPVVITIPKGGYVPVFSKRHGNGTPTQPQVANKTSGRLWLVLAAIVLVIGGSIAWRLTGWNADLRATTPDVPRLLVQPFEDQSLSGNSAAITTGLTQEIIGQIAKFKDIIVVEAQGGRAPPALSAAKHAPRYALAGSVLVSADTVRLQARLLNRQDGSVVWANSFNSELKASELVALEAEIAEKVSTALAQPYGVIFQADASRHVDNPPDDWVAYVCTLSYYAYRASLDAKTHPKVRKCLEEAVGRFPGYATAWALLSQTYVDEIRFRYPVDPSSTPASIDRALEAANRAVELDPANVRGLQAQMFALYFNQSFDAALKVGEQAMALNPNDTELIGEYGYRLALSGDWERGCPLVAEARNRNPGPLGYYESALSLCAYFRGDHQDAVAWIKKTGVPGNPNYHLIAAAVFGEGGYTEDAARESAWLLKNAPALVRNVRKELAIRIPDPNDLDRMLGSLRKAGLPIAD